MRAAAEVGEVALGVGGDVAVFEVGDKFILVGLTAIAEELERIGLGNGGAVERFLSLGYFDHFLLDLSEIFFANHNTFGGHYIVVKTIFDGGTDTELRTGPEFLNGFGHKVCRGVPEGVFTFGVFPLVEGDFGIFGDGSV